MRKVITIRSDSVKTNPKPSNRLKYALGKIAPSIFGMPIHMQATLRDEFGNIKLVRNVYNTVTTAGKNGTADQILAAPTLAKPIQMAVGTGSPDANALGVENTRVAFTSKTRSANVVTAQGDYAAGVATAALTEAGWFDAVSVGNMWLSASFSVINKGSLDTLSIVWTFSIS